jgi:CheY-like chemotaxis protein
MKDLDRNKRFMLIVDNHVDDRSQTGMLLERFGYNIFSSSSAEKALAIMRVTPPIAVFADAGEMGIAILDAIKKNLQFSEIPLLLLSTTPNVILEEQARQGEFAAFLRKPLDINTFILAVESVLLKEPRRKIRIATTLRATLIGELSSAEGLVTVLSERGMFLRTIDCHPLHTCLTVNFEISGNSITVEAEVVYSRPFDEGPFKEPGMGMKFVKITPTAQANIKAFILDEVKKNVAR